MPQKGQKTVTLSEKNIPKKLTTVVNDYDQSFAGLITYCIWLQFGTSKQKQQAKKILGLFK